MSNYRDPTLRGDGYPSAEEIDPTRVGAEPVDGAYATAPAPPPMPEPEPDPIPHPGPPPRSAGGRSTVTRHLVGSVEVVT